MSSAIVYIIRISLLLTFLSQYRQSISLYSNRRIKSYQSCIIETSLVGISQSQEQRLERNSKSTHLTHHSELKCSRYPSHRTRSHSVSKDLYQTEPREGNTTFSTFKYFLSQLQGKLRRILSLSSKLKSVVINIYSRLVSRSTIPLSLTDKAAEARESCAMDSTLIESQNASKHHKEGSMNIREFIASPLGTILECVLLDDIEVERRASTGCGHIVKSLLWIIRDIPMLIIVKNDSMVDKLLLSTYLNCSSVTDCNMASITMAQQLSGCEIGTIPAIPLKTPVKVIIDLNLLHNELDKYRYIYSGSSLSGLALQINVRSMIANYPNVEVANISTREKEATKKQCGSSKSSTKKTQSQVLKPNDYPSDSDINRSAITKRNDSTAFPYSTLRRLASSQETDKFLMLLNLFDSLNSPSNPLDIDDATGSGKTALHLAAWKGKLRHIEELLNRNANVNIWSTNIGNYGKTAIFYAITRCRDDIVMALLAKGAWVKIINNKGQSPRSLAVSHLSPDTVIAIEEAEMRQEDLPWLNFRATHSDGGLYGDLDPRFLEEETFKYLVTQTVLQDSSTSDSTGDKSSTTDRSIVISKDIAMPPIQELRSPCENILESISMTSEEKRILLSLLKSRSVFTTTFDMRFSNQINSKIDSNVLAMKETNATGSTMTGIEDEAPFDTFNVSSIVEGKADDISIEDTQRLLTLETIQLLDRSFNVPQSVAPEGIQRLNTENRSSLTQLEGVILSKRHVGKLLVFANLIPLSDDVQSSVFKSPSVVANKYTRLSWNVRNKTTNDVITSEPIAVQLIIGKTMFRRYGEEIARSVCRCVAPGQIVLVSGRFSCMDASDEILQRRLQYGNTTLDFIVHDYRILSSGMLSNGNTNTTSETATESSKKSKKERKSVKKDVENDSIVAIANDVEVFNVSQTVGSNETLKGSIDSYHKLKISSIYNIPDNGTATAKNSFESIDSVGVSRDVIAISAAESSQEEQESLQPNITVDCVYLIDDVSSIKHFAFIVDKILHQFDEYLKLLDSSPMDHVPKRLYVGVDCEWRPQRSSEDDHPVALLQIAIAEEVFLIDLLKLLSLEYVHAKQSDESNATESFVVADPEAISELDAALSRLFGYDSSLMLGFGLHGDLKKLHHSYPMMKSFQQFPRCLDISQLMVFMKNSNFSSHKSGRGLSKLSLEILGRLIDKSQQCSPWHERPLTMAQIEYASLDAVILLRIFDQLGIRALEIPSKPISLKKMREENPFETEADLHDLRSKEFQYAVRINGIHR